MDFPEHPFWDFTLAVHGKQGVHEACLQLQRDFELDINVLFFCCWAGGSVNGPLSMEQVRGITDAAKDWQKKIVRPIWKARWLLKGGYPAYPGELVESLRKDLVQAEVNAEHIEMIHLARTCPVTQDPDLDARKRFHAATLNLRQYLLPSLPELFSGKGDEDAPERPGNILGPLSVIFHAAFPEIAKETIDEQLHKMIVVL